MKSILTLTLLLYFGLLNAQEEEKPIALSWHTDMESARKEAADSGKPIFLYFTADWCGYCHKMEDNTLKTETVSRYLSENYVLFKVDYDNNKDLVAKYRISGVPASIISDPALENAAKTSGYMEVEPFMSWSKEAEFKVSPAAIAAAKEEAELYTQETSTSFREGLSTDQYKAIRDFFQKCADRDPKAVSFAKEHLVAEVKYQPNRFCRFLKDEKLHVRILTTNAFAQIYGSKFAYDPWDQTKESEAQLEGFLKEQNISSLLEDLIDF